MIACLTIPLFYKHGAAILVTGVSLAESTNVPYNLVIMLRAMEMKETRLYKLISTFFYISFMMIRILVFGIVVMVPLWMSNTSPIILKALVTGFYVHFYCVSKLMIEKMMRSYSPKSEYSSFVEFANVEWFFIQKHYVDNLIIYQHQQQNILFLVLWLTLSYIWSRILDEIKVNQSKFI